MLTIAIVAVCFCDGAFAIARPRHAPAAIQEAAFSSQSGDTVRAPRRAATLKQKAAPTPAADRDPYVDPAAPYKADRLSPPWASQRIPDIPGQTTVLTRQVLDDMNATSLRDALRSTAGVTVGR
jgi:outer membrane receptor for monomeric catechols